jgi:hypothetical protein
MRIHVQPRVQQCQENPDKGARYTCHVDPSVRVNVHTFHVLAFSGGPWLPDTAAASRTRGPDLFDEPEGACDEQPA